MSVLEIKKNGFLIANSINEYHIEPDGTIWERIFHHSNPANNLFTSSDTFTTGVYKNENSWFNFSICNILNTYELMVIQSQTINSSILKYRWIQSKSPLDTDWAAVAKANITINSSSGYTTFNHGGLIRGNSPNNTYLACNNGTSGNYWGAVGCYKVFNSGIPGWGGIIPTTGFMDVYVRVDNIDKITKLYKPGILLSKNFYEF